ncbi:interferon-inducible GTPase 5-like [Narcine bancroftii]|uniref:interferon-inducible GTPase 5-like n=1 Tax=Narcine bancroftii TaxID=1343680 RepID=UPI003832283E
MEEMMMFFYDLLSGAADTISRYLSRPERTPGPCPRARLPSHPGVAAEQRGRHGRTVNVAVTGPAGCGKSSLILAMLGRDSGREELPRPAVFPANPRVLLWEVAGVEKPLDLAAYDFFVLLTSGRIGEDEARLAQDIERRGRQFLFVRNKIDVYALDTRQRNFEQDDLLREIRRHFVKKLQAAGVKAPRVFLLSALQPGAFDFNSFLQAFGGEFSTSP